MMNKSLTIQPRLHTLKATRITSSLANNNNINASPTQLAMMISQKSSTTTQQLLAMMTILPTSNTTVVVVAAVALAHPNTTTITTTITATAKGRQTTMRVAPQLSMTARRATVTGTTTKPDITMTVSGTHTMATTTPITMPTTRRKTPHPIGLIRTTMANNNSSSRTIMTIPTITRHRCNPITYRNCRRKPLLRHLRSSHLRNRRPSQRRQPPS
jgi:hypothetical protein